MTDPRSKNWPYHQQSDNVHTTVSDNTASEEETDELWDLALEHVLVLEIARLYDNAEDDVQGEARGMWLSDDENADWEVLSFLSRFSEAGNPKSYTELEAEALKLYNEWSEESSDE